MATLCEGLMLGCFGLSWPLNVVKSLRSRSAKGKSIFFEIVIICGYLCGICGKLYSGAYNIVLALYFINLFVVSIDLVLTIRNKRLDLALEMKETVPESPVSAEAFMTESRNHKLSSETTHNNHSYATSEIYKEKHTSDNYFIPVLARESLRQLR